VRQLIHDCDFRLAHKDRIDVHFFEHNATMGKLLQRDQFEIADAGLGLRAVMSFDKADDDVMPLLAQLMRLLEHPVGFANAGGTAQIDL